MRGVSIVGIGMLPVRKEHEATLRQLAAQVVCMAMADAGVERVDALFAGNMLGDELQSQKHVAALIADEVGLREVEALQVRAATATGAAALRMAFLAVASGQADLAVAVGVEKMSEGVPTPALAKALDAEKELPDGATMVSKNAELHRLYLERYRVPEGALAAFSVNAHKNARHNPCAMFRDKRINKKDVLKSRVVYPPIRLYDCSPICDGAAAVVLAPTDEARAYTSAPVRILASSVAIDRFRIADREDPLWLEGAEASVQKAFRQANVNREDVDLFELHDAFSIMACLSLEAAGFAPRGQGWRLAKEGAIGLKGKIPVSTMGGLKARGHPIGATAIYQACEIALQLTGRAGKNQVKNAQIGLMQSVGGVASTVVTHILGV